MPVQFATNAEVKTWPGGWSVSCGCGATVRVTYGAAEATPGVYTLHCTNGHPVEVRVTA